MKPQSTPPTRSELAPSDHGTDNDTNQTLSLGQNLTSPQAWPEEIIVEPARLATGIWGDVEGDITAAYCADTFPKVSTFIHNGQMFANCGGSEYSVDGYPLLAPEDAKATEKKPYSYEGKTVTLGKRTFVLGPKIKFTARDRTIEEEISLLQRMYAHGGYFAAGRTYREMLLGFFEDDRTFAARKTAIGAELAKDELPATQAEMLERLGALPDSDSGPDLSQPTLPGL